MRPDSRTMSIFVSGGIVALVWFVFGQTIRFPFVNYDDPEYVVEVPQIGAGLTSAGIRWAFTNAPSPNWYPLTNISHMIERNLFGANAGGYHLTNVLLHATAAVLLFFVLRAMAGAVWRSAFVAAVFAIHPLRVESVAWVVERKDVLSGLFFMLTLGAYLHYTRRPSVGRYVTMSILYACGLMSKPMLVTMPFVLLLLDHWPLARSTSWRKLVAEKFPLFVMSILVAAITSSGIAPVHSAADALPFSVRIANAILSYVIYIRQMFWPNDLAVFYPFPAIPFPVWQVIAAALFLVAVTIAVIALRKSRPYLFVGWFWYLSILAPVIGLVQINRQAHADRYTYLPHIGLCLALTWLIVDLTKNFAFRRQMHATASVIIIAALALTSRAQASYWSDSENLWRHTLAVTRDNAFAHASLADLLMRRGRVPEAISHSEEALRIRPNDADGENNLGLALLQLGDERAALSHLQRCLAIDPRHMNGEINLAWVLATSGDDSVRDGAKAVGLAEDVANHAGHENVIVLRTLAAAYAESGRFSEAITTAERARELAQSQGQQGLIVDLTSALEAYRANRPLRTR